MLFRSKECVIAMGFYTGNKWTRVGSVKINMADMVDKGDVLKTYTLEGNQYPVSKAKVECTFRIDSGKSGSLMQAVRMSKSFKSSDFDPSNEQFYDA